MGTRAVITFIDEDNTFHVYKHWDGYPENILGCIDAATLFAWELPRFEADEFAAAFIAACKSKGGGDIRLTHTFEDHSDLEFRYEVRLSRMQLDVRVFTPVYGPDSEISGWVKYAPGTEGA
jgi:hypothetical protein